MRNKIIQIIIILSSFSIIILSCEKPHDTISNEENIVSAMLSFNGQEPLTLDAKIRSTGFIKSIDISQKDTSITIQAGDSLYKLAVTLHNITKPGTYPFNRAFNGRKSVSCQYVDYISGDIYATCRMPSAGSITLAVISNDLIVGVFNAELTNVYPGSSGTIKTISLTNGYFNGKLETVIR